MKCALILVISLISLFLFLGLSDAKSYGKSKSKGPINKAIDMAKKNPKNIAGAVIGGYVAHKVAKKVIKKPKIKIGGGSMGYMGAGIGGMLMMGLITREGWGARPSRSHYYFSRPASRIFIHHTTTPDCYEMSTCMQLLQSLQNTRMDVEGLPDIGYNFMIGGDGRVYQGLGWQAYGHYRPIMGEESIAVAFLGDFSLYPPNDAQLDAFRRLIRHGDERDYLKSYRIHGHRDVACTSCPGDALYALVRAMPRYRSLPPVNCFNLNQTEIERF